MQLSNLIFVKKDTEFSYFFVKVTKIDWMNVK